MPDEDNRGGEAARGRSEAAPAEAPLGGRDDAAPEPPEPPPSLPVYFGGYALVFAVVVVLALLLALAARCLR